MNPNSKSRTELADVYPPTREISEEAGHSQISPIKAIRAHCLDCCVGQVSEIAKCEAVNCNLWPFRAGKNPYRKIRRMSDEERQNLSERLINSRKNAKQASEAPDHQPDLNASVTGPTEHG